MLTNQQIFDHIQESCANRGLEPGVNEALLIASHSLMEVIDKSGADYSLHYLTVALDSTHSDIKKQIGILHDVVEDTDWTIEDLQALGFDKRVINGVKAMTRDEENNENYFSFIERCSQDPYAIDIKLNDLRHNLDQSRNTAIIGEYDAERIKKYNVSYQYLLAVKKGKIKAGTPVNEWASEFFANDPNYGTLKSVFEREGWNLFEPRQTSRTRKNRGLTPN
jgi:(p)ppGpp synthase/HD superfamily hydrolase